jgi:HEAT repeat protein
MVACGALADPELLPRYRKLLAPEERSAGPAPGDAVAVAAAWGVARMRSKKATKLLTALLESSSPEVRALAAVGLGLTRDAAHAERLAHMARSPQAGPTARAAAALALGELGHEPQRPLLLALTDASEARVRRAALVGLARLDGAPDRIADDLGRLLAGALLSEQHELRKTALATATALAVGDYRRPGNPLPVPDGVVRVEDVLRGLAPRGYNARERLKALAQLSDPLAQAARAAVATSPERARIVAELTLSGLSPLLAGSEGEPKWSDAERSELARVADSVGRTTTAGFVALTRHPAVDVRKRAVEFLASRDDPDAHKAVIAALRDSDPSVVRTALASLRGHAANSIDAVVALLRQSRSWSIRARAAEALGRMSGTGADASSRNKVAQALAALAHADDYALVREAALRALAHHRSPAARTALKRATREDAEARVRELARTLLAGLR